MKKYNAKDVVELCGGGALPVRESWAEDCPRKKWRTDTRQAAILNVVVDLAQSGKLLGHRLTSDCLLIEYQPAGRIEIAFAKDGVRPEVIKEIVSILEANETLL